MAYIKDVKPFGYYDKALNRYFHGVKDKREFMKQHGIMEEGSMESEMHRRKRLHEEIEEARKKQGFKPRSWAEYEEKRKRNELEAKRKFS